MGRVYSCVPCVSHLFVEVLCKPIRELTIILLYDSIDRLATSEFRGWNFTRCLLHSETI